jgi:hypothetical protein
MWTPRRAPSARVRLGPVTPPPRAPEPVRGVVRLLNTSGGRALCLAGEVDPATVESHVRRYGREPMPVDVIDAGSVTHLSMPAFDLLLDHLDAAERAGRTVRILPTPVTPHGQPST